MIRQWQMFMFVVFASAVTAPGASLLDQSFKIGTGGNAYIEQALEQPDGKILICGLVTQFDGKRLFCLGRLNSDGSIDTTFNHSVDYWVRHMLLQPDGKIVIGGMFNHVGTTSRNLIARLNPDGSLDPTFNPGRGAQISIGTGVNNDPRPFIIWMDLLPDGKILATGNFREYDGVQSSGVVRINPDGSRDASFNVGAGINSWGRFVKRFDNNKIALTGWFTSYNNRNFNRLVILNSDGSFDASVNAFYGDKTAIYTVHLQSDGKWITAGHSLNDQGLFKREIVRLNPNGSVDESWPTKANEKVQTILPQPDGKLIIVGEFSHVNDVYKPGIARLNADGSLDPTFHVDAAGMIWGVHQTRDKKLLVCGQVRAIDGVPVGYLARLVLPEHLEQPLVAPQIGSTRMTGGKFRCEVASAPNAVYALQYKEDFDASNWISLPESDGTGASITLEDSQAGGTRFYRIQARRKP
jgi:uncharacterized delta-60 repeat protein